MTAIAGAPVVKRSLRPRGLTWVMLRLHSSALVFFVLLAAVALGAFLWANGPGADAAWAEYRKSGCDDGNPNLGCDWGGPAYQRYDTAVVLGAGLINVVAVLTALWAGAALIGRELENGTAQLAWTQSVSPARWLAAKLALPAALLTVGTASLTLAHRQVWSSGSELRRQWGGREWFESFTFTANGTLPIAYALLALALGALAGVLTRRSLPALSLGSLSLLVIMGALDGLRPYLWPAETQKTTGDYPDPVGMTVGEGLYTSTGARLPGNTCVGNARCIAEHDIVGHYRDYHPVSHFWPLQLVGTGIALALAALAVITAFTLIRRRTGAAV